MTRPSCCVRRHQRLPRVRRLSTCGVACCGFLALVSCQSHQSSDIPPSPLAPSPVTRTLSGQVLEVVPGGVRVPVADFPVLAVVIASGTCSPPCTSMSRWTYNNTTTGPDGTYHFAELPNGPAVLIGSWDPGARYRQVCGAGID